VMVARKRGPKKGHGLRPLIAEDVAQHQPEATEAVEVAV